MKHLKRSLTQPLNKAPLGAVIAMLAVALLGFADAAYLTIEHFQNKIPPCLVTGGCETVLTSPYSIILGVPVSLLGALYYLAVLIGLFIYVDSRNLKILRLTLLFTFAGFIASLWFLYLQAFVIHSYCQYCLGSALTSTLLLMIAMTILAKNTGEPAVTL